MLVTMTVIRAALEEAPAPLARDAQQALAQVHVVEAAIGLRVRGRSGCGSCWGRGASAGPSEWGPVGQAGGVPRGVSSWRSTERERAVSNAPIGK